MGSFVFGLSYQFLSWGATLKVDGWHDTDIVAREGRFFLLQCLVLTYYLPLLVTDK